MLTTFQFNPADGTPQEVIDGVEEAGAWWEFFLLDPNVVVSLDIAYQPLPAGGLANTFSNKRVESYSDIRQAIELDATSPDDQDAVANLPAGPALDIYINLTADNPNGNGSVVPYVDNDGGVNNLLLKVNTALGKALGIYTGEGVDGDIIFNNQTLWDYDGSDGIDDGAYDFVATAAHEIGHALGFVSGVGDLELSNLSEPEDANDIVELTLLDLYRYSDDSLSEGPTVIDFTADMREKFFSFDGGATRPGTFSTGEDFGDGYEASHWEELRPPIGLMDAAGDLGELTQISELDLQAFDVIGWDLELDVDPTPPPITVTHLSGTVFHDDNDNGVLNSTEMGIPGHIVFYDANADGLFGFGEQAATTNDSGFWLMVLDLGSRPEFGPRPDIELRLALSPGTVSTTGKPNEAVAVISADPLTNHSDINFGVLENIDYGDAPQDLAAPMVHSFPTVGPDAASHGIVANFHLGATVDGEPAGLPGIPATGDDLSGIDDEDGISFPAVEILPGAEYAVTVIGSSAAFVGYYQMWIDFDLDGDWDDPGEQVLSDVRLAEGPNELTFSVPSTASTGVTYARGRLGFSSGLGPDGHDLGGEVEDYQIVVGPGGPGPLVIASSGNFGSVDFLEIDNQPVSTSTLFEMTAAHTGLFTMEAAPTGASSNLQLHVYDPNGTLLASSSSTGTDERLDVHVDVGDDLLLWFSGDPNTVDLRMTNLVVGGDSLYVYGSAMDDDFALSMAAEHAININGVEYLFPSEAVSSITFYSGDGRDIVNAGAGWIAEGDQSIARHELDVYSQGNTLLRISKDMPTKRVQLLGNFGIDSVVDATDLDILFDAIRVGSQLSTFDINGDGSINRRDADFLIQDVLHTTYGDSDLDGDVDIADFNQLAINFNPLATYLNWSQGDHDGDGDIDITDFHKIVRNFSPISTSAAAHQGAVRFQRSTLATLADLSNDVTRAMVDVTPEQMLRGDIIAASNEVALRTEFATLVTVPGNGTGFAPLTAYAPVLRSLDVIAHASSGYLPRLEPAATQIASRDGDAFALLDSVLGLATRNELAAHGPLDVDLDTLIQFGDSESEDSESRDSERDRSLAAKLIDEVFFLLG